MTSSDKNSRKYPSAIKWLLTLLVIYFIFISVRDSFSEFNLQEIDFDLKLFLTAQLLFIVYHFGGASIWRYLTRQNRVEIPLRPGLAIWFRSILGKYVPGKALMWAIRFYSYKELRKNLSSVALFRCFLLEYLGGIAAAVLLLLICFSILPASMFPYQLRLAAIVLLIVSSAGIHPKVLNFVSEKASNSLGIMNDSVTLNVREVLKVVAFSVLNWLVLGLSMFVLVRAFAPEISWSFYLFITASYVFAGVAGFLALFAPSGVGVREGIYIAMLSMIVPLEIATVISVAARLISTIGEVLMAGIASLLWRSRSLAEIEALASES